MAVKKLDSMHYRMLRIIKQDYKRNIGRMDLDLKGRARPELWSKYSTANLTIKIRRDKEPRRLHAHLRETIFYERRKENVIHFYGSSKNKGG